MTVSMRVMLAGDDYKYLLRTVVAGDGDRSLSTPLTRYYAEAGTHPGAGQATSTPSLATTTKITGVTAGDGAAYQGGEGSAGGRVRGQPRTAAT